MYKSFTTIMSWESEAGGGETFDVAQELLVSTFPCVSCRRGGGEQVKGRVDRCSSSRLTAPQDLQGQTSPSPHLYIALVLYKTSSSHRLVSPEDATTEQHF